MKKFFKLILIIMIILIFFEVVCFADDDLEENVESVLVSSNSTDLTSEPKTYSKHIICIERTTNSVLYEKDAYSKCAMASTTKILTGIIIIENCDLKKEVENTLNDLGMNIAEAVTIFLKQVVLTDSIPFIIQKPKYSEQMLQAIKESDEILKNPNNYKSYNNIHEVIEELENEDA